jgi:hypothetical protein
MPDFGQSDFMKQAAPGMMKRLVIARPQAVAIHPSSLLIQ